MTTRAQRVVIIGQIAGVFGVRGWMKIYSHTEPREAILRHRVWFIYRDGEWRPLELLAGRVHGKGIVAHLKDCDTPEQARAFIGCDIGVLRSALPALAADEYYWVDLEGLRVLTQEGVDLGVVDHLLVFGANDVLVVRGERERLIPYIRGEVVSAVDLTGRDAGGLGPGVLIDVLRRHHPVSRVVRDRDPPRRHGAGGEKGTGNARAVEPARLHP